jgi:hypothetical protein
VRRILDKLGAHPRIVAVLGAIALTATLGLGCTLGPDEGSGVATLTVTRDFGSTKLVRSSDRDLPEGETAMRFLQRRAEVETRYGGRFANAINGLRSRATGGSRSDWFYYVNGIEADVSAAERELARGDRVWWDYHEWSGVMRVPAVVGSFPEPFIHGSEGKRFPVRIDCAQDADQACRDVATRLDRAGVTASSTALGAPAGKEVLRMVVGTWSDVRRDGAARQLERGPQESGVFARVARVRGGYALRLLDPLGHAGSELRSGAGIVAATRFEEQQPTWVVTGTDRLGLRRAVTLLEEAVLRDRFAVATTGGRALSLPTAVEGARPR